jgi:hypothetical protein
MREGISFIRIIAIIGVVLLYWAITYYYREYHKFNREVWTQIDGNSYELRKPMADDLIDNHLYEGMRYEAIIRLLGKPEISNDSNADRIGYYLEVDYGWRGFEPEEGTNLMIELASDSTIKSVTVEDWGN